MKPIIRFLVLTGLVAIAARVSSAAESPFGFEILQARAKELAAKPYSPPQGEVPEWLRR